MNAPDQENLLSSNDRVRHYPNRSVGIPGFGSRWTDKIVLVSILTLFGICSAIYIYLNLEIDDTNQTQPNRFKPLSRRKPMLDHESIFSDSGSSMIRVADLLAHCIVALRIAGKEVVNLSLKNNDKLDHLGSKGETLEGVNDVITGADMRSHHFIVNILKDSYRRLRVVSEEDSTKEFEHKLMEEDLLPISRPQFAQLIRSELDKIEKLEHLEKYSMITQDDTLVWIDPLDATKEYSENLTEYVTLMACIVHENIPIAGIIFKPFTNQTFWSLGIPKANRYHHSIDLVRAYESRADTSHEYPDIIVSRSHEGKVKKVLKKFFGSNIRITQAGGSGYKTVQVITGQADAYVHITRIKKWDICAPYAIMESFKDGQLTDLTGQKIGFGDPKETVINEGLIATMDRKLHKRLISATKDDRSNAEGLPV